MSHRASELFARGIFRLGKMIWSSIEELLVAALTGFGAKKPYLEEERKRQALLKRAIPKHVVHERRAGGRDIRAEPTVEGTGQRAHALGHRRCGDAARRRGRRGRQRRRDVLCGRGWRIPNLAPLKIVGPGRQRDRGRALINEETTRFGQAIERGSQRLFNVLDQLLLDVERRRRAEREQAY